jgi:hypothetical protein
MPILMHDTRATSKSNLLGIKLWPVKARDSETTPYAGLCDQLLMHDDSLAASSCSMTALNRFVDLQHIKILLFKLISLHDSISATAPIPKDRAVVLRLLSVS